MADIAIQNQKIFKEVVQALSYPGKKVSLNIDSSFIGNLLPETMNILFTLLDGEVSYHILGDDQEVNQELQFRTMAQTAEVETADYIVVPLKQTAQLADAIHQSKKGTASDPNLSATFIIECVDIQADGRLSWSGPGIQSTISMDIVDSEQWLASRAEAVSDFPLGIDILLVGKDGNIVGLPRSTKVEEVK